MVEEGQPRAYAIFLAYLAIFDLKECQVGSNWPILMLTASASSQNGFARSNGPRIGESVGQPMPSRTASRRRKPKSDPRHHGRFVGVHNPRASRPLEGGCAVGSQARAARRGSKIRPAATRQEIRQGVSEIGAADHCRRV